MKPFKSKLMTLPVEVEVLSENEYSLVRGGTNAAQMLTSVNNGNGCSCQVNNGNGCGC